MNIIIIYIITKNIYQYIIIISIINVNINIVNIYDLLTS